MGKRRDAVTDVLGDESPLADLAQAATQPQARSEEAVPATRKRTNKVANDRPRRKSSRKAAAEPLGRAKRMKVSIEEERTIEELVANIARQVGTKVQFSHVARAMWSVLLDAEAGLETVSAPSLHRPENGNLEGLAEFEADLADYLLEVFKASRIRRR